MRVTGSMTIFCRGIVYPNLAAGLGDLSASRSLSTEKIRSAGRRAAGHEDIDRHHFVHGGPGQQLRDDLARDLRDPASAFSR